MWLLKSRRYEIKCIDRLLRWMELFRIEVKKNKMWTEAWSLTDHCIDRKELRRLYFYFLRFCCCLRFPLYNISDIFALM